MYMKEVQIVYDFDGTLTPNSVPFFPILQNCGITEKEFHNRIEETRKSGITNIYESWFQTFLSIIQESNLKTHDITVGADTITFNQGVEEWFLKLASNTNTHFSHYIITSGIEEFLCASKIANYMTKIYGVSFIQENGKLKAIEKLISDKGKVDYLKMINSSHGRDENDCTNLVYIGDGLTDYYAMEFVFQHGGTSILVTPPNKEPEKKLFAITHFQCDADYRENQKLYQYIKKV